MSKVASDGGKHAIAVKKGVTILFRTMEFVKSAVSQEFQMHWEVKRNKNALLCSVKVPARLLESHHSVTCSTQMKSSTVDIPL